MPYDLGATARLSAECRDAGGTLTNATTVTLTITLPDGTAVTPAVTNPPATAGQYSADYTAVQAGRHSLRWVFTGAGLAHAYADVLDVREATPRRCSRWPMRRSTSTRPPPSTTTRSAPWSRR
ncbi:hypothetical protein O1L44_29875 [Streptomyces noursei]|nr:hypothetical protein [Streptomyces noursei]